MKKKILILGGTFDPIHTGHIGIARQAAHKIQADGILLLPSGEPPYRKCRAGKEDRLAMTRLAAELLPNASVSTIEITGEGPTYTSDTLEKLHAEQPETQWFYLIGSDKVEGLSRWKGYERLRTLCEFVIAERPGAEQTETDIIGPDISASEIRTRVAEGRSLQGLVPDAVAAYIAEHGLYLCDYSQEEILQKLKSVLKPGRVTHILGVADTAKRLAPKYGIDPQRAYLAGLLHDCAKYMPFEEMQALVRENVPDTDEAELNSEPVLHAPAGSVLAAKEYGVRDPAILSAIRRHTIGGEAMSPLDRLIYAADFTEPNRKPFDGLESARAAIERDLREAVLCCTELTHRFVLASGGQPHPKSIRMINELLKEDHRNV